MVYGHLLGLLLAVELNTLRIYSWGQTVPASPCPETFQYQSDTNGLWYGLITIPTPEPGFNVKLTVEMSIDAILPTRYAGKLQLVENKDEVWRRIITRDKQPVQYQLFFPISWPLPIVRRITSNQKVVCNGNPPNAMMTKLSLEHTLYPIRVNFPGPQNQNQNQDQIQNQNQDQIQNQNQDQIQNQNQNQDISLNNPVPSNNGVMNPPEVEQTSKRIQLHIFRRPVTQSPPEEYTTKLPRITFPHLFTHPPTTVRTTTPKPTQAPNTPSGNECGVSLTRTVPLIINGAPTERGEWPWLVAMYTKSVSPGLQFQCGGSLLSGRVVLTAAHCIKYKGRPEVRAEAIILYMGKYNLEEWTEKNNQPRDVERVHIHPDYSEEDFEADLAVLILKSKVDFTIYVQPICLWDFSSDIKQIVGQIGTVVGWGKDESGRISSEPRKAKMPIVSQDQCLLSKKEFVFYTSNRTFCAGDRNGSGPCSGDSGGGFMMNYPDGDQMRWYLRGVIHLSLYDKEKQQCDLRNYLIYTDVAKFMDWIRQYVPY